MLDEETALSAALGRVAEEVAGSLGESWAGLEVRELLTRLGHEDPAAAGGGPRAGESG